MFQRMTKPKENKSIKGLVIFLYLFLIFPILAFAADKTPPSGSITINSYASYTSSASVSLNLSASDKGSGMKKGKARFSNDNSSWSSAENYKSYKSWTLSSGDGTKTVYVKFCDSKGNWMRSAASDSITLDVSKPSKPTVTDSGSSATSTSSLYASWSASDSTSGISEYQYQIRTKTKLIVDWTSAGTSTSVTKNSLSLSSGKHIISGSRPKTGQGYGRMWAILTE